MNEIRVGITGHRILAEIDKIEYGVERALNHITERYAGCSLVLLSSLAEGSDRIAARLVLNRKGGGLVAVLPFDETEYINDFPSTESIDDFRAFLKSARELITLPSSSTRDQSYEAAGLYVLDHCAVLMCIWDGNPAQGTGGTGGIVQEARKRKMPIAWIHAGNRKPGTHEPTTLGEEQGTVTFEGF